MTKKCDICEINDAVNESEDPFASEIDGDYSIQHYWCNNQKCIEIMEDRLEQSALDI